MLYIVYLKKAFSSRGKWVLFCSTLSRYGAAMQQSCFQPKPKGFVLPFVAGAGLSVFSLSFMGSRFPAYLLLMLLAAFCITAFQIQTVTRLQTFEDSGADICGRIFSRLELLTNTALPVGILGRGQRFGIRSGSPHLFRSGHSNPQCQPAPGRFTVKIKIKIGNLSLPSGSLRFIFLRTSKAFIYKGLEVLLVFT